MTGELTFEAVWNIAHPKIRFQARRWRGGLLDLDDLCQLVALETLKLVSQGKLKGPPIQAAAFVCMQARNYFPKWRRMYGWRAVKGPSSVSRSNFLPDIGEVSGIDEGNEPRKLDDPGVRMAVRDELAYVLKAIPKRGRRLLWSRYVKGVTLQELGGREGLTRSRMNQIKLETVKQCERAIARVS